MSSIAYFGGATTHRLLHLFSVSQIEIGKSSISKNSAFFRNSQLLLFQDPYLEIGHIEEEALQEFFGRQFWAAIWT